MGAEWWGLLAVVLTLSVTFISGLVLIKYYKQR